MPTDDRPQDHERDDRGRDADEPTEIPAAGWRDIAIRVKEEFAADHVSMCASAVAFHAFLALVPLLVAAVSVYGLVADPTNVTKLVGRLGTSVPRQLADLIEQQLTSVVDAGSSALGVGAVIGVVAALWSASSAMSHLMEAINIAYDEDVDDRPFWKKRGLALALTVAVIVFLVVVSTVVSVAAASSGVLGVALFVIAGVVSAVLLMGLLATIYRYAADRDEPEWSWVSVGAGVAVAGWLVASVGFTLYVSKFGSYNETYGSLGAIVVVLLWMFITALVVLVGAEVNAELEHQTAQDTTDGRDEPIGRRDAAMADNVGHST